MKVILLGLAGLVLAVLGVPASAGQITLNGSVDANLYDPTGTGDFTQIQTNPVGLVIENFAGYPILPFERRAVIEFSTSPLPSNASIQSVTFNFETTSTANNEHLVGVLAYAGNGTITLADATTAASQVGTYEDTAVGSTTQVSLTSSDFQSLFDQRSGYFALRLQGLEQTVNTSIAGIAGAPFTLPTLTIDYTLSAVPEPSSLVLGCTSVVSWLLGFVFVRRRPGPGREITPVRGPETGVRPGRHW